MICNKIKYLLLITLPLHGNPLTVPERFTTLRTIAGAGQAEDLNSWQADFEGASPLSVELSNPHDCGTDAFGRVYIVDKESHSVLRVSADGSVLETVAGTHLGGNGEDGAMDAKQIDLLNPNGLHVFADGSFLILDTDNGKVREVDSLGLCRTLFTYNPGFGAGRGLVSTPDRSAVYFCGEFPGTPFGTQLVKKWTPEGVTTVAPLPSGSRGLGNLDLAPDGSLFVTSAGDHRVYRIAEGAVPEIVAGNGLEDDSGVTGDLATEVSLNRVRGIAILPDGSFFVATQKGGDIWWVDNGPNGDGKSRHIHLFLNGASNGNVISGDGFSRVGSIDRISEPRALHLASNADLLITTNDTGVIRAIRNVCKPAPPLLAIDGTSLSWQADRGAVFWLEESSSLISESWVTEEIFTAGEAGKQSFALPTGTPKSFFRLQAPQFAGGQ